MSFAAELLAIQTKIKTDFETAQPGVPIVWPNTSGDPPANGRWVRVTILTGDANQVAIGQGNTDRGLHRSVGIIEVQCFAPLGEGALKARQLADSLYSSLCNATLAAGILCKSPRLTEVGARDAYYQVNLSVPYQRDEIVV